MEEKKGCCMNTFLIFDIILFFLGIYLVFLSGKMKKQGKISDWILAEEERKKCKKPKEFIAYLAPRAIIFGGLMAIVGILGLINDTGLFKIPYWSPVELIVFLVIFGVFWTQLRRAREKFL